MMTCSRCNIENEDTKLFCRSCMGRLERQSRSPEYRDENFEKMRKACVDLLEGCITYDAYVSIIADMRCTVLANMQTIECIHIPEDVGKEVKTQLFHMEQGLQLFLEGVDMLLSCPVTGGRTFMATGLDLLENGNDALNIGMKVINEQERKSASIMDSFKNAWRAGKE